MIVIRGNQASGNNVGVRVLWSCHSNGYDSCTIIQKSELERGEKCLRERSMELKFEC